MGRPARLTGCRARGSDARDWIANTTPQGPVYVNLDAEMQEAKLAEQLAPVEAARFMPPVASAPDAQAIAKAATLLKAAKSVVMLIGRVSRNEATWNRAWRSPRRSARGSSPV